MVHDAEGKKYEVFLMNKSKKLIRSLAEVYNMCRGNTEDESVQMHWVKLLRTLKLRQKSFTYYFLYNEK